MRGEAEPGFRPVPIAESHTRIGRPERQSYFPPYAAALKLELPVILVGGSRDVEQLEAVVRGGQADFIALRRPLINEPDLPDTGGPAVDRISCNSCVYAVFQPHPEAVRCLFKEDKAQHKAAQARLRTWVEESRRK